jgi:hypothetical protein
VKKGGGGGGERAVAKGGGEEGVGEGVAVERETGRRLKTWCRWQWRWRKGSGGAEDNTHNPRRPLSIQKKHRAYTEGATRGSLPPPYTRGGKVKF